MNDDIMDDPEFRRFSTHTLKEMVPMLDDSAFSVSIVPSGRGGKYDRGDVKYWVELGASIMLDKPIIALIDPGAEIPERLRRVADVIIEVDLRSDEGREKASEEIAVAIAKLEEARE